MKVASSKWIKRQGTPNNEFSWQGGYGAFAVSESQCEIVTLYISQQAEHHRKASFQEEYRVLLERHRIAYDERYVWD